MKSLWKSVVVLSGGRLHSKRCGSGLSDRPSSSEPDVVDPLLAYGFGHEAHSFRAVTRHRASTVQRYGQIGEADRESDDRGGGVLEAVPRTPMGGQGADEEEGHRRRGDETHPAPTESDENTRRCSEFSRSDEPVAGPRDAEVARGRQHLGVAPQFRNARSETDNCQ